jgi:probable phosphoglycerate mutase
MAELPAERKNQISHRGLAFRVLRGAVVRAVRGSCSAAAASFLLVRHGESMWNAEGRWQGHADPPLSERGVAQAEALARALDRGATDLLLSSDLRRAWETAEIIGRAVALSPRRDPRLRELDVGRLSGLTRAEIAARDPIELARFDSGDQRARAGGAESRAELRDRVRRAFRELVEEWPGARVIAVTHLGVVRALAGADLAPCERIAWSPSSVDDEPPIGSHPKA